MNAEAALREHLDGKLFAMRYDNGLHVVNIFSNETPVRDMGPRTGTPKLRDVLQAAADVFGLTVDDLLSGGRYKLLCRARWVFYAVGRSMRYSMPELGRVTGSDHTTVLHGLRHAAERNPNHEQQLARVVAVLRKRFPEWREND